MDPNGGILRKERKENPHFMIVFFAKKGQWYWLEWVGVANWVAASVTKK